MLSVAFKTWSYLNTLAFLDSANPYYSYYWGQKNSVPATILTVCAYKTFDHQIWLP